MDSISNLSGSRCYLAGAMDRVKDGGVGWRQYITPYLEKINISVIDPCTNPIHGVVENEETRWWIDYYKETKQFHKIKTNFEHIRKADLRCIDISDFIIAHIDIDIHACGTYEEIVTANRQKKPILIWCKQGKSKAPNWLFFMLPEYHIFSNFAELYTYINFINTEKNIKNLNRWFFFKGLHIK
jgi:hypothetical protein